MNKEVIYLEPEDDITDILTKLQQAEQKIKRNMELLRENLFPLFHV